LTPNGCRHDSSSAPAKLDLNKQARKEDWWTRRLHPAEQSDTDRSIALLNAYDRIAHGDDQSATPNALYADGLRLDAKKSVWTDRSVMARLLRGSYVKFLADGTPNARFELTAKGREQFHWR
jgi:hypothetical protein